MKSVIKIEHPQLCESIFMDMHSTIKKRDPKNIVPTIHALEEKLKLLKYIADQSKPLGSKKLKKKKTKADKGTSQKEETQIENDPTSPVMA